MATKPYINQGPQKAQGIHNPPAKRLFPIEDAAVYLGISPKTIRNRLGPRARVPFPVKHKKIGKRVLFDKKDLDAFVDSLETH